MKPLVQRAGAAGALILTLLTGCDNVSWGGTDVTIVPPPPRVASDTPGEASPVPAVPGVVRLPDGPILYRVSVTAGEGSLHPLAVIAADTLLPIEPGQNASSFADAFIARHLREGAEFVLFHDGARAGTLIVENAAFDAGTVCRPLPSATGTLELSSAGRTTNEFLALARPEAPQIPQRTRPAPVVTRSMQVVGPILAERMMRARRASLPGNWQRAMAQLKPFPLDDGTATGFTATFLVGDTLGPGLDDQGYSLFFVAIPEGSSYETPFVSYRPYPETGKQAPRVLGYLDWDRDGEVELLLRVYGVSETWLEAVSRRRNGEWRIIFDDRCAADADAARNAENTVIAPGDPVIPPDTLRD